MLTLKTPRGKTITIQRYISLISAHVALGSPAKCEKGHAACAGWEGGPCSRVLLKKKS